jgi:hypothetical protein
MDDQGVVGGAALEIEYGLDGGGIEGVGGDSVDRFSGHSDELAGLNRVSGEGDRFGAGSLDHRPRTSRMVWRGAGRLSHHSKARAPCSASIARPSMTR